MDGETKIVIHDFIMLPIRLILGSYFWFGWTHLEPKTNELVVLSNNLARSYKNQKRSSCYIYKPSVIVELLSKKYRNHNLNSIKYKPYNIPLEKLRVNVG